MNDEAVYRTAPATPGLLKTQEHRHDIMKKKSMELSESMPDVGHTAVSSWRGAILALLVWLILKIMTLTCCVQL